MPLTFEFANWSPSLFDIIKMLQDEDVLAGEAIAAGGLGEPARLSTLEIQDHTAFREFGFGIFLAWLHEHKFGAGGKFPSQGSYHLVYLTDDTALFLSHLRNRHAIDPYGQKTWVGKEAFIPNLPTGNWACDNCALRWALKYNHSCLTFEEGFDASSPEGMPIGPGGACEQCKSGMRDWLIAQILRDDRDAVLLGGDGLLLEASPRLFQFVFKSAQSTPEELFNSFLVIDVGLNNGFAWGISNAELSQPISSDEIDGLLFDDGGERLMAIETTRSYHIHAGHLRRKIKTASSLAVLAENTLLAYLTLADPSSMEDRECHNVEFLSSRNLFSLVGVPDRFKVVRTLNRCRRRQVEEVFDHYLDQLNQLARQTDI